MSLLLLFNPSPVETTSLVLFDETGLNPLPPGILVLIYPSTGQQNENTLVGSGWTTVGGVVNGLQLFASFNYIAVFIGNEAPPVPMAFSGGTTAPNTTLNVTNYRSPVLSYQGYADVGSFLQPQGWYEPSELVIGGGLHAIMRGTLGGVGYLDEQGQIIQGALRLMTCTGSQVDSWAFDFLGNTLTRFPNESDASFIGRIIAALSSVKTTIAAITAAILGYYTAIAPELAANSVPNLSYDGFGSYDGQGAYDMVFSPPTPQSMIPTVYVWDHQSRPDLDTMYQVTEQYGVGWFVVQIGFQDPRGQAFFLDHSFLDCTTFLIQILAESSVVTSTTDTRLSGIVTLMKAAGTLPLYLTYQNP